MHACADHELQVVRAAMEHVASIKIKGRAAGPCHAEFQRLYNPSEFGKSRTNERSTSPPRPVGQRARSAPRPKSRLADDINDYSRVLQNQRSSDMGKRVSFNDDPRQHAGRSQSAPRSRHVPAYLCMYLLFFLCVSSGVGSLRSWKLGEL